MKTQRKELPMRATSSYADSASSSDSEHVRVVLWAVVPLAVGAIAAIVGLWWAAVRARRERVPHSDIVPAGVQIDGLPSESVIAAASLNDAPQGFGSASTGAGSRQGDADHGVNIAAAIKRRPRVAAAVAALVVVLGVSSIVMFETLSNRQSHMTEAGPAGTPAALHRALAYAANTPPAQLIPAAQGEEPRRDWQLDGQRFEMVFGKPWLVTQVGFRPLELVPGRRVTKLRWELNDPDRTVFLQDADAAAGGNVIWTLYLGEGSYRTTGITATVLDTVPAPDASPSASPADRSPLVAYGNRNGEPTDTPNSGFGHPAAVNRDDYPWVAQHESSGALTVLFRRPISLTSIVFTPKGGA